MLRNAVIRTGQNLKISDVCDIQYALYPKSMQCRSSVLASKTTGIHLHFWQLN